MFATFVRFLSVAVLVIGVADVVDAQVDKPKKPTSSPADGKPNPALLDPSLAKEKAPEKFRVKFTTTKGDVVIEVVRSWSPNGADRFYNLVKIGYFEDIAFFRVINNFMVQFGIHGNPRVSSAWSGANIKDDTVVQSNKRGFITFAKTGAPNSRSTQFFINYKNNANLDGMGFSPFGKVVEGMDVVNSIYKVGEGAPRGPGPGQQNIKTLGNKYLKENFPKLDYIKTAALVK